MKRTFLIILVAAIATGATFFFFRDRGIALDAELYTQEFFDGKVLIDVPKGGVLESEDRSSEWLLSNLQELRYGEYSILLAQNEMTSGPSELAANGKLKSAMRASANNWAAAFNGNLQLFTSIETKGAHKASKALIFGEDPRDKDSSMAFCGVMAFKKRMVYQIWILVKKDHFNLNACERVLNTIRIVPE